MSNEGVDVPTADEAVDHPYVEEQTAFDLEPVAQTPADDAAGDAADEPADGGGDSESRDPSWWHRDHPVFTSLVGFFTGMAFFIIVPGLYGAILGALFDYDTTEQLFPYIVVALAIPIGLLIAPATRRFGRYMAIGIVSTAVVVLGAAALTFWLLVTYQG